MTHSICPLKVKEFPPHPQLLLYKKANMQTELYEAPGFILDVSDSMSVRHCRYEPDDNS